jgi:hypothetical protein
VRSTLGTVLALGEAEVKSFDGFLERRFPQSRRKAYCLRAIQAHLPPPVKKQLKHVGWSKAAELVKVARSEGERFESATWLHKAQEMPKEQFKQEVEKYLTGQRCRTLGADLLQALQEPGASDRASDRYVSLDAGLGQISRLRPGDDLR